ncbi:hypothetical protein [Marinobacter sp.]|uniref:hypothetical protein n=1 Tax=Marinobacter sp. TaxID=50741 RepID=UPI003568232C
MGSTFQSRTIKACDENTLKQYVAREIDQAAYEEGNSYSGDLGDKRTGLIIKNLFVADRDEAFEWIDKNYPDKDDPLVALKIPGNLSDRKTQSIEKRKQKILDRMNEQKIKLGHGDPTLGKGMSLGVEAYREAVKKADEANIALQIIKRVAAEKAQFKTCQSCESKINKKYLTRHQCPVCGNEEILLTNTDKKRLEGVRAKIKQYQAQIDELDAELKRYIKDQEAKMVKDGNWFWFVGGWCRD